MARLALNFIVVVNADSCIDHLNSYRTAAGLPALMDGGVGDCETSDAAYDCANGWHSSFGQCGEGGQCEAACGSCEQGVDMFYAEGPGGGHYDIMMSTDYGMVYYGVSENCASQSGNNFYTFNFFSKGFNQTETSASARVWSQPSVVAPEVSVGDACIAHLNSYRTAAGLPALMDGGVGDCETSDAAYDCANGWHSSFGQCGEGGQCEAACGSCEQGVDMFYAEGPGGGHYDIMMSTDYGMVYYGVSENCASQSGNNFYTFNFFSKGLNQTVAALPRVSDQPPKSVPEVSVGDACIDHLNSYRTAAGLPALSDGGVGDCETSDAAYDCANGWHSSFGQCGEGGQCEAACGSCEAGVDMFYAEGPGGGHYDIMMSTDYGMVYYGVSENCASQAGNNFYTFNFFNKGESTNATASVSLPAFI